MKSFFRKFILFLGSILALLYLVLMYLHSSSYPKEILTFNKKKNILILGDSQTEVSINDEVLSNSINISQSADNNLYSYVKLRAILNQNKSIDTVFLCYSYYIITKEFDDFYEKDKYIEYKLPKYYQMLGYDELLELFKLNPKAVLRTIPTIIKYNLGLSLNKSIQFENLDLGKYKSIGNLKPTENQIQKINTFHFSELQMKYLTKIYKLCCEKSIKLVLISPPIQIPESHYPSKLIEKYYDLKTNNLTNIKLLNYSHLPLDKSCFADAIHLNSKGSLVFTNYLRDSVIYKHD